jgi:hypothetical protein
MESVCHDTGTQADGGRGSDGAKASQTETIHTMVGTKYMDGLQTRLGAVPFVPGTYRA